MKYFLYQQLQIIAFNIPIIAALQQQLNCATPTPLGASPVNYGNLKPFGTALSKNKQ